MKYLLSITLLFISTLSVAQGTSGEIWGTVVDENGEPFVGAVIQIDYSGIIKGGTISNFDGIYIIKPVEPGTYTLTAKYLGYKNIVYKNLVISSNKSTKLDIQFFEKDTSHKVVMEDEYKFSTQTIELNQYENIEIDKMPTRNTSAIIILPDTSNGLSTSRVTDGTIYMFNDCGPRGSRGINLPYVDTLTIPENGTPAKYSNKNGER